MAKCAKLNVQKDKIGLFDNYSARKEWEIIATGTKIIHESIIWKPKIHNIQIYVLIDKDQINKGEVLINTSFSWYSLTSCDTPNLLLWHISLLQED